MRQNIIALDARCIGNRKTGDSTYWAGLVYGLNQIESDLCYLLFSNDKRPTEIPDNERLRWVQLKSSQDRLWSLIRFPLAARKMGARVLHTQYNMSPLVQRGVTTVHDVSFFVGPQWFKPRDRVLLRRFVPASARHARRVITVSETSKADIQKYISGLNGKVAVTPLAPNPAIIPVAPAAACRQVEAELGIEGPFLLTVGTRWPRKNMSLAIEAAELLPANLPHRLVVTGHPGWGNEAPGKRVQAVGYVSDAQLGALYSAADLYLAPSRYEGFGLTVLEAFSCGCPVMCSTGGSLPEVAGNAASVQTSWEAADWSEAIEDLLKDSSKLESMRSRGLVRAGKFSWKSTARLTEEVYLEAMSAPA